ncbi:DgyrCDS14550 [Dimorphilus gyrociliatus]|uniref:DgyrCDS14550 n=1 Tax=Dimorphilus gyrociliatus TaxID=2664684 RepID=A0A7I8WEC8_9ANNE|nr:DgyrCDS14550 [Dimorphilus gyrociliatus]
MDTNNDTKKDDVAAFLHDMSLVETRRHNDEFIKLYSKDFDSSLLQTFTKDMEKRKLFLKSIVENPQRSIIEKFLRKNLNLLNFNKYPELFKYCYDVIFSLEVDQSSKGNREYGSFSLAVDKALAHTNGYSKLMKDMIYYVEKSFDFSSYHTFESLCSLQRSLNWEPYFNTFVNILHKLEAKIEKVDNPLIICNGDVFNQVSVLFDRIWTSYQENVKIRDIKTPLSNLFNNCYKLPLNICVGSERKKTLAAHILLKCLETFYNECKFLKEFLPPVIETIEKLKDQDDDIEIQVSAEKVYSNYELTVERKVDAERQLVDNFLAGDESSLAKIVEMYPRQSNYIHKNFQYLLATVKNLPNHALFEFMELVEKIIQHNPSVLDEEFLEFTFENLDGENSNFVLNVMYKLMSSRKDLFANYHERLGKLIKSSNQYGLFVASNVSELVETQELATFYTNLIWEIFYKVKTEHRFLLLSALKDIVCKFKEPVAIYKDELLKLEDGPMADLVRYIINVLEGRSLEGVAKILDAHQDELENLDIRVTDNSDKIVSLDSDLVKTKERIEDVAGDVEMMKSQVKTIEYNVKNLDEQVEQLSHMTLSHAPSWSRHLSDLMNKPSDNDWRLLALKLNYGVDDVRNWATQPDPCLSLLDEWFATNKTKEATFAILKNLKDMDRLDAAEIVEDALESVKSIVKDEKVEMVEKPKVFISYQWGHQKEIKLLCNHLEKAGFKAWMDIGQMGGGDSLFQKIDDGIRSAEVILSCVSLKYAKSANCCREINLSTNLGKLNKSTTQVFSGNQRNSVNF